MGAKIVSNERSLSFSALTARADDLELMSFSKKLVQSTGSGISLFLTTMTQASEVPIIQGIGRNASGRKSAAC